MAYTALVATGLSALATPIAECPAGECNCTDGLDLNGHDLPNQPVVIAHSAAECCAQCRIYKDRGCAAWAWNKGGNKGCYLKATLAPGTATPGCVMGVPPGHPAPPVPPPPPPPPQPICNIDPPGMVVNDDEQLPQCPWYNSSLSADARLESLIKALTAEERLDIMLGEGVDRLHVPHDGFNEAAHGVAWAGRATVFPCSMVCS